VGAAIVSAFHPSVELLANAQALLSEFGHVVVVDDGTPEPDESVFASLAAAGATVVRSEANSGIAAALNRGIDAARASVPGLTHVVTFDQDSRVIPGFAHRLVGAWTDAEAEGFDVAMVAPGRISGLPRRALATVRGVILGDEPIQSGLLVPIEALDRLGPFDESLFIDGVDTEFFLRAVDRGMASVIAPEADLLHSLGSMVGAEILGLRPRLGQQPLRVRVAAPWRYYYITRNRVAIVRAYGRRHLRWAVKAVLGDLRHLTIVSALAPGRGERLRNVAAGLADASRHVSGRRP
jgi:rhamnosyltransferase